jgi:SAM-dependent methyltransferase
MAPVLTATEPGPLVGALLADLGVEAGGVDLAIDPHDEMLGFLLESSQGDRDQALWAYFQSGASIAASMAQVLAWRFGTPDRVGKLLDFASGYGRVTRFLVRRLPAERIWVSDVYAEGVRFQEQRFGVHGIVSTVLPEDFGALAGAGFDAILVTSLFTHLPAERFVAWLRVLMGLLAPGGVLAFSVHDQALLPLGAQLPPGGLLFQEISESGSLATHDYGSTWVSEAFVHGALARACGGGAMGGGAAGGSLHRLPRGLCNYQDLYVAVPEAGADFSRLGYRGEPRLFVERCALAAAGPVLAGASGRPETDRLELRGWAAMPGTGSVEAVEVLLDDQLLARLPVEHDRPEVAALLGDPRLVRSGWGGSCRLPATASRSRSVLRLRLVDDLGHVHPEAANTLEAALHASTRLDVTVVERELRRAEERAAQQAAEAAALRLRIAAMEASRFWKLRNQWFRCKAWLGLGAA